MNILRVKDSQGNWIDIPAIAGPPGRQGDPGTPGAPGAPGAKGDRGDTVIIATRYEDLTFPVTAGTYCLYADKPYVAKTDIQTTESWTAAHWDAVSFEDDISDLKSALNTIEDDFYDLNPVGTANSFDVTDYSGKSIPKVTSSISVSSAMSSVDLYCCGKNHLKLKNDSQTTGGITWTTNPTNGSVTLNGTASQLVNLFFEYNNSPFANVAHVYNTKWRASITKSEENSGVQIGFNGQAKGADVYENAKSTGNYARLASIAIISGTVCDNLVVYPMVEFGDYAQSVSFEPFYGFIETHTFSPSITTATVDWGEVDIPTEATTLWIYNTAILSTIYIRQSVLDDLANQIDDLEDEVSALSGQVEDLGNDIDGAYAHKYEDYIDGWSDVTYYTDGFVDDDGSIVEYGTNAFWYTDYISSGKNDKVIYNLYGGKAVVTFYNSAKEKISNIKGTSSQWNSDTVLAPENTAYIRFCEQHGNVNGTFSIQEWTSINGDEIKAEVEAYADSLVTITQENSVLTRGDIPLISGSLYHNGGIYSRIDGVRTDYIPVSEGDTVEYRLWNYFLSPIYQYALVSFNASKTEVSHIAGSGEDNGYVSGTYTVPSGIAFIMLSWAVDDYKKNAWFRISLSSQSSNILEYTKLLADKPKSVLKGKQWCCLGDSITAGPSGVRPYWNYVQDRTDITPYNYGIASTSIAKDSASSDSNFATRYVDMYDDVDYVTVFGGTNDHGRSHPIGQWGDSDQMTLYGAMKILCEGLITKYPGKKIGFLTPLPKCTTTGGVTTDYSYPSESFMPYIECIKNVCARYSIPVLDLYTQSGLHPSMADYREDYIPDGLHPNSDGQELLSYRIQSFLESL